MSDKFIDYRTFPVALPTLADLDRYIPTIERAVLCDREQMTSHLVITSDQLRFEKRAGNSGHDRLSSLIHGIKIGNPYQYRDGTHSLDAMRLRKEGHRAARPRPHMPIETAFREFLNWLARSGYRYVVNESDFAKMTADDDYNYELVSGLAGNVLYNPMESMGNCRNVAQGFAMMLVCLGVPVASLNMAYIKPNGSKGAKKFAYVGAKASRGGAVFYETTRNRNEYRSLVIRADGDRFVAVPGSEIDNPFGNHWVVKARGTLWDGNYACRYDDPSQVCEAYSIVDLQGVFTRSSWQLLSPLDGSDEQFVAVGESEGAFKDEIIRVTGDEDGGAYFVLNPGDPGCQVKLPSSRGPQSVPLRLAREAGYVVPSNWKVNNGSQAFVKNAVATAIGNYRNDTGFWNKKSPATAAFLKSAVKWIGTDDARCRTVKSKFFENDNLAGVVPLPDHAVYGDLYKVLGFDPVVAGATPNNVIGPRLRKFLLNAFKVPDWIKLLVIPQ